MGTKAQQRKRMNKIHDSIVMTVFVVSMIALGGAMFKINFTLFQMGMLDSFVPWGFNLICLAISVASGVLTQSLLKVK